MSILFKEAAGYIDGCMDRCSGVISEKNTLIDVVKHETRFRKTWLS
jgi:hypothetical protein